MLTGKGVLVTGGTGSFGQAFARTVLDRYKLDRLVIFSRDEQKQYEMRQRLGNECIHYILGDVRDRDALGPAFKGIDVVVHAAALKQVGAAELNPREAVKTNIDGSANVIREAAERGIGRVIEISTDKAVHPVNVYGATKFVADKLFVSEGFSVARLGNFASRGSVVPYFRQLVAAGATELPVTDARMTRFWLSLTEAVEFVIGCVERMKGREIFVPSVPSVRIPDIAKAVASTLGTRIVGIRPGEKLHETLLSREEAGRALRFAEHYVIRPSGESCSEYSVDALGGRGVPVEDDFEYTSGDNDRFLSVRDLQRQEEFAP